jgi:hypothetical protein
VNLLDFRIKNAGNFDPLSFETMDQVGAIETVNVFTGRQDKISAEMLNAISGAGVRRSAHRLRLQHFFVRPGQRMHVHCTLTVGHFSTEHAGILRQGHASRG